MPDPLFRQRLRRAYFDLRDQLETLERGSPGWFDCEKAMLAIGRLHVTLYKEPVVGVHTAGNGARGMSPP